MSKNRTELSAADLLETLCSRGLVSDQGLSDFVIDQQARKDSPLYINILVGVGTFIASMCFTISISVVILVFVTFTLGGIDFFVTVPNGSLIVTGLGFIAGAFGLLRVAGHGNTVWHDFFTQSSFATMGIGKALFVSGVAFTSVNFLLSAFGLLIVTVMTYPFYQKSLDRFLSPLATLLAFTMAIFWERDLYVFGELDHELYWGWVFNAFFLLQFVAAAILFTHQKTRRSLIPLSYALVTSLCIILLFLVLQSEFAVYFFFGTEQYFSSIFPNIVLTCGLIALIAWVGGGAGKLKTEPLIMAFLGAALLGLISAPGIIMAVGLMILGYARHERPLIMIGIILVPILLFHYYFSLDISLLQKSGVLIGSGVVMLAGSFYIRFRGWNKGDSSCAKK